MEEIMSTTTIAPTQHLSASVTPVMKALSSARYVINAEANKTDIVLPLPIWEKLLEWLEDQEDRALVREMLPRLKMGPEKAGALSWDEVADEWNDEATV